MSYIFSKNLLVFVIFLCSISTKPPTKTKTKSNLNIRDYYQIESKIYLSHDKHDNIIDEIQNET